MILTQYLMWKITEYDIKEDDKDSWNTINKLSV